MKKVTKMDGVRDQFTPFFRNMGLIGNHNRRIWMDDNGFYFTVAELEPLYGDGFFLNLDVEILWRNEPGCQHFSDRISPRILVEHSPIPEVLFFDAPTYEEDLTAMMRDCETKLFDYRKMRDPRMFAERLAVRRDLFYCLHKNNCNDVDVDLAVAEMLNGNTDRAVRILRNTSADSALAAELLEYCGDADAFRGLLLEKINATRSYYRLHKKYCLSDVTAEIFGR